MKKIRLLLLLKVILFAPLCTFAQQEYNGWLFISHTQKLPEKFELLADVQLRSDQHIHKLKALLLRGALGYRITDGHAIAIGYVYLGEWERETGTAEFTREHRSYLQYQYKLKKRIEFTLRGRLEQRFQQDNGMHFSQRARAFANLLLPMKANTSFEKGIYLKLQDEIFLNVQHCQRVNGSIFDQHRPYTGIGYRAGKKLDLDFGYMRLLQREKDDDKLRHTLQLMATTSL